MKMSYTIFLSVFALAPTITSTTVIETRAAEVEPVTPEPTPILTLRQAWDLCKTEGATVPIVVHNNRQEEVETWIKVINSEYPEIKFATVDLTYSKNRAFVHKYFGRFRSPYVTVIRKVGTGVIAGDKIKINCSASRFAAWHANQHSRQIAVSPQRNRYGYRTWRATNCGRYG